MSAGVVAAMDTIKEIDEREKISRPSGLELLNEDEMIELYEYIGKKLESVCER